MTYYFVELARAKRAIRVALILLGLFLLAAIIFRLSVHETNWQAAIVNSPTAHVTKTRLPDGSVRSVVDDPARQTRAIIVEHPGHVIDIDVTEPVTASRHHGGFSMGSMQSRQIVQGGKAHSIMHFEPGAPRIDLTVLVLVTVPMGLIMASILGGVLAKENDGHLELAWTKPISREQYAVYAILVDAVAIIISQVLTIAVGLLAMLMLFVPRFYHSPNLGWAILLSIAGPIAWYALITVASASLKRGPGMVCGLAWILAIIIPSVGAALHPAASFNAVAAWFFAIFNALTYIDPIAYLSIGTGSHPALLTPAGNAGILCALSVVYLFLAVVQWRRVEA